MDIQTLGSQETNVYREYKFSGQAMGKEFQTFSVMVSGWNGVGQGRSKYRILEPAHPAAWILPHHAGRKRESAGAGPSRRGQGEALIGHSALPLALYHHGGHSLSIYYGQPHGQAVTKSHETHKDLTRRTASLPLAGFTFPYNM